MGERRWAWTFPVDPSPDYYGSHSIPVQNLSSLINGPAAQVCLIDSFSTIFFSLSKVQLHSYKVIHH